MKLKGLAKVIKDLQEMQEDIEENLDDNLDRCGTTSGDKRDDQLNDVWGILESAIDEFKTIKDI